jgi:ribosomal protein L31
MKHKIHPKGKIISFKNTKGETIQLEIYSNVFADNKTIILDVDRYTHPA